MFALNLGYNWKLASAVEPVRAIVYLPYANHAERVQRAPASDAQRVLLDPQLYLIGLDATRATKACARLATYPWFNVSGIPGYDSTAGQGQREWEARVREVVAEKWPGSPPDDEQAIHHAAFQAVNFQLTQGCTHIILAAPLAVERENEAETLAAWMDAGVEEAQGLDVGQPLLATVALDETTLNEEAFDENGFLDTVVDQISSRDGIDGVYIVISQTHARHPFESSQVVWRAYLHLCSAFSAAGIDTIFTNFCDVFGLLCAAVGATGLATGQSGKLRRLSLAGFDDSSGGGKYLPHLYSHKVVAEYLTETDLDPIMKKRLLGRVRDITPHSQPLFAELQRGGSAANLPNWAESHMKVAASQRHFLHRAAVSAQRVLKLSLDERQEHVRDWIESSAANDLLIQRRLGDSELKGRTAPTEVWLELLDEYLA